MAGKEQRSARRDGSVSGLLVPPVRAGEALVGIKVLPLSLS